MTSVDRSPPHAAREHDVVAVVDLAPVVPGAGLARERQAVAAAPVLDVEEALRDVDVRRPVLAHRAELDQVGVGRQVPHRVENVQRAFDVVALHPDGVLRVHHRVGRRGALAQVDDRLGPGLLEQPLHQVEMGQVAHDDVRPGARGGLEAVQPGFERSDRQGRTAAHLADPAASKPGIDAGHFVAARRQVLGQGPAQVAVDSGYENARDVTPCRSLRRNRAVPSRVEREGPAREPRISTLGR